MLVRIEANVSFPCVCVCVGRKQKPASRPPDDCGGSSASNNIVTFRLDVKNSCLATTGPNQSNAHWFLMFVFLGFDMGHHKYINTVAVDRSDALLLAYVLIFGTWLFAGAGVAQEFCVCCGEQREDEARPRLMAAAAAAGGDVVYKFASFVEEEHQSAVQQPRPQEPGTSPPKRPRCC